MGYPRLQWARRLGRAIWLVLAFAGAGHVAAHEPSKSYLNLVLASNQLTGQWDLPISELKSVVALTDKDGLIAWEDLRDHYPEVLRYAGARLKLRVDDREVTLRFTGTEPTWEEFTDGPYLQVPMVVSLGTAVPQVLEVDYRLFFETNALHRGMLRFETVGGVQSTVFSPDEPVQRLAVKLPGRAQEFARFLREGVGHIWTGYDHILFLLALLLPAVLRREGGKWAGVGAFRPAFVQVVKIVTAFTAAHSVTLSLAALHLVKLRPQLTESAIAGSVMLAALNNLWPVVRERGWLVAFGFGLIHGFGFANALGELGLREGGLALVLVGFNLGVELGQLAIVAAFLPLAYTLRHTRFYQTGVLRAGSVAILLVAAVWLAERLCDKKFLPF